MKYRFKAIQPKTGQIIYSDWIDDTKDIPSLLNQARQENPSLIVELEHEDSDDSILQAEYIS